jgi:periplasmic protein TonB
MNASGLRRAPEIIQRAVVLVAIASLHILIVHLLAVGAITPGRFDDPVLEADVLPPDQRPAIPPAFPDIVFQASSPLKLPVLQLVIDATAGREQPPAREVEKVELHAEVFTNESPPPKLDPVPVMSPRPITGPRGIDRYPNESMMARESGTVTINICVSSEGHVDSVALTHSSGFPRLDAVALGIASEYQFKPALRLGHPVAACDQYRIVFKVI